MQQDLSESPSTSMTCVTKRLTIRYMNMMGIDKQGSLKRLIVLAKNGDNDAFEEVYENYYTPLFRYILSRVRNREEAEDMTQVVFMKIWNSLPNWKVDHTSPLSFFFKVAHNTLIDYYRKNKNREIVSDEIVNTFLDDKPWEDKNNKQREAAELINQIISNLSNEQQEIITLIYTNDLTYEEISQIVGKKEDTIRQIHSRALKKLRELYKETI